MNLSLRTSACLVAVLMLSVSDHTCFASDDNDGFDWMRGAFTKNGASAARPKASAQSSGASAAASGAGAAQLNDDDVAPADAQSITIMTSFGVTSEIPLAGRTRVEAKKDFIKALIENLTQKD